MPRTVYKIATRAEWERAQAAGLYHGSRDDVRDGFIHFSTAAQARATAAKFFSGKGDLVLAAIDADRLAMALRWEPSRGGELFPHLYGVLDMRAVVWTKPLPPGQDGGHIFPPEIP
jgi:uncharacterized protein (DUF952 family)